MSRSRAGLLALALTAGLACAGTAVLPTSASADPDRRAQQAEQAARSHPEQVALDGDDALAVRDEIVDADGTSHVRFDRTRAGLPVLGGDLVVHQAADGSLRSVSATTRRPVRVDTSPSVSREQAEATARDAARNGATAVDPGVLEIDSRNASAPRLVWSVVVHGTQADQTPSELLTLVDARSGRVVGQHEQVETVDGLGKGYFNPSVVLSTTAISGGYSLKDATRGGQYTVDMGNKQGGNGTLFTDADNTWGDGTLASRQSVGVDAQYGTAQTWDYYKNVQSRTGIDGKGTGASNRVHYGRNYNNAYWSDSCYCMTYGDGDGSTYNPFDSLDVAGHEMSHGVTSRTANLTYSGESGGLNEANSDIFGTAVEFFTDSAADVPDYKIGEELYKDQTTGKALRYMYNPNLDGQSPNCYSSGLGSLDVHYSSGVANRFAFLLAEGSATTAYGQQPALCTGNTGAVSGIGRDAAQKVWYRALTTYMTSSTNYSGARAATLAAAGDLDASGAYAAAVTNAWNAVGVTK